MLRDHDLQNAVSGASNAVSDTFHVCPYADPTSELAQRLSRVEAALADLQQHAQRPSYIAFWINRILNGWPGYGYDPVNTLEAVASNHRPFNVCRKGFNL